MGTVVPFVHSELPPGMPKIDGEQLKRSRSRADDNTIQYSAGMRPRARQFQTAVDPTPASLAAACMPPTDSTTSETDLSMRRNILTDGEIVKPHKPRIAKIVSWRDNPAMDGREDIAMRLIAFQQQSGMKGTAICRKIDAPENSWIQWTDDKYDRIIPTSFASRLCTKFELTLDWIYRGIPASRVPEHIADIDIKRPHATKRRTINQK